MSEELKIFIGSNEVSPIYITLAGITYPDSDYYIKRTNSDVSVIEYIVEGEGYVCCDGETHHLSSDTVYFLHKGENHLYYADRKNPYQKIFMNVTGTYFANLTALYGLDKVHFFRGDGLKHIFERIPDIIRSKMTENEMQSALQGILIEIISNLSLLRKTLKHNSEALILKEYLDANLHRIVSAKEYSKIIYRSKDYCQKLFIREFNVTPYAYQINMKMQKAKILLKSTNMTIGEIAEALGYSDAHYFSNLFKTKCGCRPLKYRRLNEK